MTTESQLTTPWKDIRVSAKGAAAAKLTLVKRQALWRAAHLSAAAAREIGATRYTGHICRRDPAHGGERYVSGGGCVECARLLAERKRRRRGAEVRGPRLAARHPLRSDRRAAARRRRAEGR